MKSDIYIKIEKNTLVYKKNVLLCDIAQFECVDEKLSSFLQDLEIFEVPYNKKKNYVISILNVIQKIHAYYPEVTIHYLSDPDFIIEFDPKKKKNKAWEYIKACFLALAIFFGSAFTIIAFDNDVGLHEIFSQLYQQFTGTSMDGLTVMELSYSIGLGAGILLFYNHFGQKNKEQEDPTPLQIEMRLYENDVNDAIIQNQSREGSRKDAG